MSQVSAQTHQEPTSCFQRGLRERGSWWEGSAQPSGAWRQRESLFKLSRHGAFNPEKWRACFSTFACSPRTVKLFSRSQRPEAESTTPGENGGRSSGAGERVKVTVTSIYHSHVSPSLFVVPAHAAGWCEYILYAGTLTAP